MILSRPPEPLFALDASQRAMLDAWAQGDTLFAFDFDGTLAPIADDPGRVRMSNDTWVALGVLADDASVAVLSGRSRSRLIDCVPPRVRFVVGNHGNEGLTDRNGCSPVDVMVCTSWERRLLQGQGTMAWPEGASVENKGGSLTIHYRLCSDTAHAAQALLERAAALEPRPRILPGLLALHLLPQGARTHREALIALMARTGCGRALYVGDHTSEEPVFIDAPPNWLTIAVGEAEHSHARLHVRHPHDVTDLLHLILQSRLTPPGRQGLLWPD
jgi:trehalose 6-phosphate phosphatase